MRNKGFQKGGRGVYRCSICKRSTREVTQANDRICPECYELAGLENMVMDGAATIAEITTERDYLVNKAMKQGANAELLVAGFSTLWEGGAE